MSSEGFYYENDDGQKYYAVVFNKSMNYEVQHKAEKSNDDVEAIYLYDFNLSEVPQGLTKLFPNIKILDIHGSKLEELSKMDLIEYRNLSGFYCRNNQLQFLPGYLFEGFEKLEWISFSGNKIKVIEPNILDGLNNLKHVDFRRNLNFDTLYSIYPDSFSNATLEEIRKEISEKFFSSDVENVKKFIAKIQEKANSSELELNQKAQELSEQVQALKDNNRNFYAQIQRLTDKIHVLKSSNISRDLRNCIQDENSKDFKIEIDGREFPVHKFLLVARSPTLAEMLRSNPSAENLELFNIPVEIFEVILKFLYTDELPRDINVDFFHLFATASRLKIKRLAKFAARNLLKQVNKANALEILDLGNKYCHNGLRQKAFHKIKKIYQLTELKDEWAINTEKVKFLIEIIKDLMAVEKKISEFNS